MAWLVIRCLALGWICLRGSSVVCFGVVWMGFNALLLCVLCCLVVILGAVFGWLLYVICLFMLGWMFGFVGFRLV